VVELVFFTPNLIPTNDFGGTANSLAQGIETGDKSVTARVIDPSGSAVQAVAFYYDSNYSGKLEPEADQLLGLDTDGTEGWSLEVPSDDLPQGANVFFAQSSTTAGPINWATAVVQITPAPDPGGTTFDGGFGLFGGGNMETYSSNPSGDLVVDVGGHETIDLRQTFERWVYIYDTNPYAQPPYGRGEVDWGDGSSSVYNWFADGQNTWYIGLSHQYADFGGYNVTVTVQSVDYPSVTDYFSVSVEDRPLSLWVDDTLNATRGVTLHSSAAFTSLLGSQMSIAADYGDGEVSQPLRYYWDQSNSQWDFELEHKFWYPGTYTMTVTVQDELGYSASAEVDVDVEDSYLPGDSSQFWRSLSRSDRERYSYPIKVNYDYHFEDDYGDDALFWGVSYSWADIPSCWDGDTFYYGLTNTYYAPGNYTVKVRLSDWAGYYYYDTFDVEVVDDPPEEQTRWVSAGGPYYFHDDYWDDQLVVCPARVY
jgi:hypothetical protein